MAKNSYINEPLRKRKKRAPSQPAKPVAPAKDEIVKLLEAAISEAVAKVEAEMREGISVNVDAPAVEIPNIDAIVGQASQRLANELMSSVNALIDGVRSDISKIHIPEQLPPVTGWGFDDFEYDEEGRLVSFRADAD